MSDPVWLCVDLGTSATKVGLVDRSGTALGYAARPVGEGTTPTNANQQDAEAFVAATLDLTANVLRESGVEPARVSAIAIDGQMGSVVGVGADGLATTPWLTNVDDGVSDWRGRLLPKHADQIRDQTGGSPYFLPGLLSIREHSPHAYERTIRFTGLSSFVGSRLAGKSADALSLDTTHLVFSGLADARSGVWDSDLTSLFDVDEARLPQIVSPLTVIGGISRTMARQAGLRSGIPVLSGVGDQVAGFLGAGLITGTVAVDVAGSSSCFALSTQHFLPSEDGSYDLIRSPLEGTWLPMLTVLGGGLSHKWLAHLLAGNSAVARPLPFEAWEARIADLGPRRPILFSPHLAGRGCPPLPEHRGAALGFDWRSSAEDFYLGLLEGVALSNLRFMQHAMSKFPDIRPAEVRTIGGGAISHGWNQLRSDIMGLSYRTMQIADAALTGDAVLASVATGEHSSIESAVNSMVHTADRVDSDPQRHAVYRQYARVHADFEERLDDVHRAYADLPTLMPTRYQSNTPTIS